MKFGIRFRFALWLIAALLPVSIAALYVFSQVEDAVVDRVGADLEGVRRLEVARIDSALELYRMHGTNLAGGSHVQDFAEGVAKARRAGTSTEVIGGYDGFGVVDPYATLPLQELAEVLHGTTASTTAEVAALQIVGLSGDVLGRTAGFDWVPKNANVVADAMATNTAFIGDAYRDADGFDRLGLVVPITSEGKVVGALVLENELGPIVDLLGAHEAFGATSEAHIVQANVDGDAELITQLRFEPDAAFSKVVPAERKLPINQSLDAHEGQLIFSSDYRGEESILAVETIPETGWGLIVKIDRAEALQPVLKHTTALQLVSALGVIGVLVGWAVFLDPVARRLRRLAAAARRVSDGEYDRPLDDRSSDEIGAVSRSIDRLATDLATDIAVRTDVENRLRHQATHDATTGLFNRQHATALMQQLATPTDGLSAMSSAVSLLFLDLDNFKAINDVYGHAAGDAVLKATGERLTEAVGDRGAVARWGGDEFVVVLAATNAGAAQDVAKDVQRALDTQIITGAGSHHVRASIGVSTLTDGHSLEELLHIADEAMFAEKQDRSGRRSVSPGTVRAVEYALENDTVEVWFQPLVADAGDSVTLRGAEALVRLGGESGQLLEPHVFLGDVERSFVGRDLDRRVLRRAISQVGRWVAEGSLPADFQLSVNCCEALMRDGDTVRFIEAALSEFGLRPENLMLEISEKSSTVQPTVIDALDRLGVQIAVDDLGLSNSNIDRLLDGGASVAKIDGRWLQARTAAEHDANGAVLRHLVSLCDALGFAVVAEGVETAEQYQRMRDLGVTRFQGYLFARPLSSADFAERFIK